MPEIGQYTADPNDVAGPIGTAREARPEDTDLGGGIQHLGAGLETAGNALEKRAVQEDLITSHTGISQTLSTWQAKHKNAVLNYEQVKNDAGIVMPVEDRQKRQDLEDNARQELQDSLSKIRDSMQTEYGKKYADRYIDNAFKQGMNSFHQGMAQMAAKNVGVAFTEQNKRDQIEVANAPIPDALRTLVQTNALSGDFVMKTGALSDVPKATLQKLVDENSAKLAFATIDGIARKTAPDGTPGYKVAKEMLGYGTFDQYLSQKDKEAAYTHVEQIQKAQDYDAREGNRQQKDNEKKATNAAWDGFLREAVADKHTPGLAQRIMDTDPVILPPPIKENLLRQLKEKADKPNQTLQAEFFHKMQLDPSDSRFDPNLVDKIHASVGPGKLTISQHNQLMDAFQNKGGHATGSNDDRIWKSEIDYARGVIGKPDAFDKITDPYALDKWNAASIAMEKYRTQMRKELGPNFMSQITDRTNKLWVGNAIGMANPGSAGNPQTLKRQSLPEQLKAQRDYMKNVTFAHPKLSEPSGASATPGAPGTQQNATPPPPKTRMFQGKLYEQAPDGKFYIKGGK